MTMIQIGDASIDRMPILALIAIARLCSPLFGLLQLTPPLLTCMLLLNCGQVPPVDCARADPVWAEIFNRVALSGEPPFVGWRINLEKDALDCGC
jgi:hypothetical protein